MTGVRNLTAALVMLTLAGCAYVPRPYSPCVLRSYHPFPAAFETTGVISIYKFLIDKPSRRDKELFSNGVKRARFGMVPVFTPGENGIFVTSRLRLRSEPELLREVQKACALEKSGIELYDYQHTAAPAGWRPS